MRGPPWTHSSSGAGCCSEADAGSDLTGITTTARPDGDGRQFRLLPPFELATPEDAIVRIIGDVSCTGTLIADDRVLTAHHCVVARDEAGHALQMQMRVEAQRVGECSAKQG